MCQIFPVPEYVRCYLAVGVKTRAELDEFCKLRYGRADVRDAFEALLQSEEELEDFVLEVEEQVKAAEDAQAPNIVLSIVPTEITLLDADTNSRLKQSSERRPSHCLSSNVTTYDGLVTST